MRQARKIQLLFIDDAPPPFDIYPEIEVTCIRSLIDIEGWLLRGDAGRVDIVICDVNMKERYNDHPREMNLTWGNENAEPAYGPLLALPLLKTNHLCEFVPRSLYWRHVESNGYVLIAVAIIRSVVEGKRVDLDATIEWIRNRDQKLSSDTNINIAEGLEGLRRRIADACKKGSLSVAGIESVSNSMGNWEPGSPFEEPDGCPLHLELIDTTRVDRIAISSLFSDYLQFGEPRSREQLKQINETLSTWLDMDAGFNFPKYDDVYTAAASLLEDKLPDGETRLHDLKQRANELSERTNIDVFCLIRIAMLFAFARAWYFVHVNNTERFRVRKKAAFKGRRKDTDETAIRYWGVMEWAYWFLGINPDQTTPQNPFKRLLGAGDPIRVGDGFYRRPFCKADPDDVLKAYGGLAEDAPAELLPIERRLCLDFIADPANFYPRGMDDREKLPWDDLKDIPGMRLFPKWLVN